MKISLNWVKQFTEVDLTIDELVEKIGAQLGAVEEVADLGAKYKGVVVARVVECNDHPNADRLHVCTIDDGGITPDVKRDERGYVQVVCGAPNVRAGMTVAWLPPGSTVPASYDTDPFVLEARSLRGVISNGMLASPKELAIGDSHDGILEVDVAATPGMSFAEVYELNDYIIDVENKMFTHRPDCFGMLGVAREIAGIQQLPFTSPEWYMASGRTALDALAEKTGTATLPLTVRNEAAELVPRFMAVALSGINISQSPVMIQSYLSRVGIRPINNVVDITNYVMVLTGQPTHAYDYDKLISLDGGTVATLVARKAVDGETIGLLNGKTVPIREDAVVIATEKVVVGLGGVMGAANSEVDDSTTRIVLEVANFDMYSIRRTSMAHGLFTDAVTRFNKGQSPHQNPVVLAEATAMLEQLAGASVASVVFDESSQLSMPVPVNTTAQFINERLGLQLTAGEHKTLLQNVECQVAIDGESIAVQPPFWRTDIEIPEDVVEEVGRLYGYDRLPLDLPQRDITPAERSGMLDLKQRIRSCLAKAGANEVLTYSFVHGNLLEKAGQDKAQAFELSNALSPDLQYYRLSILPSLLDKIHMNIRAGHEQFALFEMGKAHHVSLLDEDGLPNEYERIGLVVASTTKDTEGAGAPYYLAKQYLERLFLAVGLSQELSWRALRDITHEHELVAQMCAPFDPNRSAALWNGTMVVGVVGEFKPSVARAFKLPAYTAGFESFHSILAHAPRPTYTALSRFPSVSQDVCFRVSSETTYGKLYQLVAAEAARQYGDAVMCQVTPVDIYQRQDDTGHKQITLRITATHRDKTMTDQEASNVTAAVVSLAAKELQAEHI